MKEKDLYPKLSHIFPQGKAAAFELKVARGEKFYFRQLEPHQERALLMTKKNGVYHKLSDQSMGQKPFDSFFIKGDAYVVVYWENSKKWYFIDIYTYVDYKNNSKIGLNENECAMLAKIKID